jgi:WD40 repeat protein
VRIVTLPGGRLTRVIEPHVGAKTIALDAGGGTLATGGLSGTALYSTATGAQRPPDLGPGVPVGDITFARRGDRVATAWSTDAEAGGVSLWHTPGGRGGEAFEEPNIVTHIAFSPAGDLLAGATDADDTVKLWSVRRHVKLRELFGHSESVTGLAFSPDGRLIATSSLDRTARVWDARSGFQLHVIRAGQPLWSVAFSPGGSRVATGDDRGQVRLWDACGGCFDPRGLLALAGRRVTRHLTPVERTTFGIAGG